MLRPNALQYGHQKDALPLLPRFVQQFKDAEAVVVPSSSCIAMMREHYPQMAARLEETGAHPGVSAAVDALLPRVFEFSEMLTTRLGLTDVGACFKHRVTCHASCHGLRSLGLGDGLKRLLRAVRGIELVEIANAEQCCGFGGTFAVKNAAVSGAMLDEKLAAALDTGAEVCTATDNSCLMHIAGGLHRQSAPMRTMHLAEILASTEDLPR
jgi:L-lactate dehydrogenase complex protein LldE